MGVLKTNNGSYKIFAIPCESITSILSMYVMEV